MLNRIISERMTVRKTDEEINKILKPYDLKIDLGENQKCLVLFFSRNSKQTKKNNNLYVIII